MMLRITALAILLVLQGCSFMSPILDPETFRQRTSNSSFGHVEEINSKKPFKTVVANLKAQSAKCLNKTINTTVDNPGSWQRGMYMAGGTSSSTSVYKSSITLKDSKTAVLVAQEKRDSSNTIKVIDEPPDGNYILVIDVADKGSAGSFIKIYSVSVGLDSLIEIVPKWISGEEKMCPQIR